VPCVEAQTRLSIKNILLATMFSEPSEAILSYAIGLARRYGSAMSLTGTATPRGIRAIIGNREVDLVVIGAHSHESRGSDLDTAVAEILRTVACPMLIVGPQVTQAELAKRELERMVYATDYTISSLDGLPYALALAQDCGAELKFVHVAEGATMGPFHFGNSRIVAFRKRLESVLASGNVHLREAEFVVQEGDRAEGLVRIASNLRASMIVITARGTSGPLWPAAGTVVCRAYCPVLMARAIR